MVAAAIGYPLAETGFRRRLRPVAPEADISVN